jgi:hypothetical protein
MQNEPNPVLNPNPKPEILENNWLILYFVLKRHFLMERVNSLAV